MKAMKPLNEEPYEIVMDSNGIKDGPRLGRLRVLNKVVFQSESSNAKLPWLC